MSGSRGPYKRYELDPSYPVPKSTEHRNRNKVMHMQTKSMDKYENQLTDDTNHNRSTDEFLNSPNGNNNNDHFDCTDSDESITLLSDEELHENNDNNEQYLDNTDESFDLLYSKDKSLKNENYCVDFNENLSDDSVLLSDENEFINNDQESVRSHNKKVMNKKNDLELLDEQEKILKRKCHDTSNESDILGDDEYTNRTPKDILINQIRILKEQNKVLLEENKNLKEMVEVSEVLKNANSISHNLTKCLSFCNSKFLAPSTPSTPTTESTRQIDVDQLKKNTTSIQSESVLSNEIDSSNILNNSGNNLNDKMLMADDEEPGVLDFRGNLFSYSQFCTLPHHNVKKFTTAALSILFDRQTLATSTLTGGVANCHINRPDKVAKNKLCPKKIDIITNYAIKNVDITNPNINEKRKLVRMAITSKTNNCRVPDTKKQNLSEN